MIDRTFSAILTFCLLAGGTLAIGSELFGNGTNGNVAHTAMAQAKIVQLPGVTVRAKRMAPASAVAQADSLELAVRHFQ